MCNAGEEMSDVVENGVYWLCYIKKYISIELGHFNFSIKLK